MAHMVRNQQGRVVVIDPESQDERVASAGADRAGAH
jgi:hypothetical protein